MGKIINKTSFSMLAIASMLTIMFFIIILFLFNINTPEKYVSIITAIVALYTPFGAYKIAEKWREQKKFDIIREHSLTILENLNQIKTDCLTIYNLMENLENSIKKNQINLSERTLEAIKDISFKEKISNIGVNLDIFMYMIHDEEENKLIKESYIGISFLCNVADQISKNFYNNYSEEINILRPFVLDDNKIEINQNIEFIPDYLDRGVFMLKNKKILDNFLKTKQVFTSKKEIEDITFGNSCNAIPKNLIDRLKLTINPFKDSILKNSGLNKL